MTRPFLEETIAACLGGGFVGLLGAPVWAIALSSMVAVMLYRQSEGSR